MRRETKADRAAREAREREYKRALEIAFRETPIVLPDVPPPSPSSSGLSRGWWYRGIYSSIDTPTTERACSSVTGHSIGRDDAITAQAPKALYSTPVLALRAARNVVEADARQRLAKIDIAIARAERAESENQSAKETP